MAFEKLAAFFGASAGTELTDEHLKSAEAKIAQLESDKASAEAALATFTTRATTAETALKTAEASLTEAKSQVATLESWKKEHAGATDERLADESNERDAPQGEQLASFEQIAKSAIDNAKKRVGA